LDVKTIAAAKPAALEIVKFEAVDRVLLTSFSSRRRKRAVAEVRRLVSSRVPVTQSAGGREVILLWLCSRFGLETIAQIISREIDALQIPPKLGLNLTDEKFISLVKNLGLDLHYWSINEVSEMHKLLNLGATGLVTDSTELAKSVISLRALAEGNA
jgi:glycerophosphoryl diester phosphodiesterase